MAKEPAHKLASGDTAYLYRAAIGPRGQDYYLRHFARFDGEGRTGSSWNWAAYWSTFNWMLYRRMWGQALFYVGALLAAAFLIFGLGKLIFNYSDTTALLLFLLLLTVAFVLPGLYANAWFYTHCNEKITKELSQTPEVRDAATALADQAPGQRRLLWLGLGNALTLGLLAGVVTMFQGNESALGQLAVREDRPAAAASSAPLSSSPVRALEAAPSASQTPPPAPDAVRAAPAPAAVASAPQFSPSPAPAAAAAAVTAPAIAQAASTPAAPEPARPVVAAGNPDLRKASDRSAPASKPAEPKAVAPASSQPAVAARTPSAPARPASAPVVLRYVWVIQVGAYAQEANAQKALEQVQGLGLDAGAESFESDKGKLMRVRVGPFMRQAEADQAALRIRSLDLPTLVIRQRP